MKLIYICGKDVCELLKWPDWGSNRGLRDFWTDQVISMYILAKNLNSKYISLYIHYIAICSIKTHNANTYFINMWSYLNTLRRIWVYSVYMWDKYLLWATVNDMAVLYGGSHDRRKNITPNYGCDMICNYNFLYNTCYENCSSEKLCFLALKSLLLPEFWTYKDETRFILKRNEVSIENCLYRPIQW